MWCEYDTAGSAELFVKAVKKYLRKCTNLMLSFCLTSYINW